MNKSSEKIWPFKFPFAVMVELTPMIEPHHSLEVVRSMPPSRFQSTWLAVAAVAPEPVKFKLPGFHVVPLGRLKTLMTAVEFTAALMATSLIEPCAATFQLKTVIAPIVALKVSFEPDFSGLMAEADASSEDDVASDEAREVK